MLANYSVSGRLLESPELRAGQKAPTASGDGRGTAGAIGSPFFRAVRLGPTAAECDVQGPSRWR